MTECSSINKCSIPKGSYCITSHQDRHKTYQTHGIRRCIFGDGAIISFLAVVHLSNARPPYYSNWNQSSKGYGRPTSDQKQTRGGLEYYFSYEILVSVKETFWTGIILQLKGHGHANDNNGVLIQIKLQTTNSICIYISVLFQGNIYSSVAEKRLCIGAVTATGRPGFSCTLPSTDDAIDTNVSHVRLHAWHLRISKQI